MDPVWTLWREMSFLHLTFLAPTPPQAGSPSGSRSDITSYTWSQVTKMSYFCLIFLCMPLYPYIFPWLSNSFFTAPINVFKPNSVILLINPKMAQTSVKSLNTPSIFASLCLKPCLTYLKIVPLRTSSSRMQTCCPWSLKLSNSSHFTIFAMMYAMHNGSGSGQKLIFFFISVYFDLICFFYLSLN